MQKGDLISIEFTGKERVTGKVFDTTNKETAEKEGMPMKNRVFGPVVLVAGQGDVLEGIDEELLKMKVGEMKTIVLQPSNAFGERNSEMVKVIPLAEFKKNNVNPVPGTMVNANDMLGKVQSVSGGRVRVDFNGDLAGKEVEYELKIVKHFTDAKEQLDALTQKVFRAEPKPSIAQKGDTVEIKGSVRGLAPHQQGIAPFAKMVLDTIKGVQKVCVTTEFEKKDFENMHMHEDGQMHANDEAHEHAHEH